jgi:hypothetical protein
LETPLYGTRDANYDPPLNSASGVLLVWELPGTSIVCHTTRTTFWCCYLILMAGPDLPFELLQIVLKILFEASQLRALSICAVLDSRLHLAASELLYHYVKHAPARPAMNTLDLRRNKAAVKVS